MSGRGPVGHDPASGAAYRERTAPSGASPLPAHHAFGQPAGQETAMTLLRTQLGNTLRGHRLRQRRTLRDVSGRARVSLGYLSEVERGQKEASSELLASICDALDVELADLLAEVSLEMRLAEPSRRTVRPVALAGVGAGARPGAPDDDPAAAAAAVDEGADPGASVAETPVAEPALALVGGGQPARATARSAVSLAA